MSDYTVGLDPSSNHILNIKLVRNVKNIGDVYKKLMTGQLQSCLVKPNLICDPFQIAVASNKAVTSESLTTRTIFTEILFNLSISKNITQSLRRFGIDESDKDILVVTLYKKGEPNPMDDVIKELDGDVVDINQLSECSDISAIRKMYKISDSEAKETPLLTSVVSRIATKDFISH